MAEIQGESVPDEESLALEAVAVLAVTGALSAAVTALLGSLYAAWELLATGADRVTFARLAARRIRRLGVAPMTPRLRRVSADARDQGQRRAVDRLPPGPLRDQAKRADWRSAPVVPPTIPDPDRHVREATERAARLADTLPFERKEDLHTVAGAIRQGRSRAEGATRWAVHEGLNAGTAQVARTMGLRLIWVAERNACLDCLAHAGWAVEPGDFFPALSFDPLRTGRVLSVHWPPLHPACRCQVRLYDGPAGPPDPDRSRLDPAARLSAEARRSVVYQWTDYASARASARAAETLLQVGAELPATVEKRARAALRSGRTVRRPNK